MAIAALWWGTLAFFWPLITPVSSAHRTFGAGDFRLQFFPFHTFAAQELAHGRLAMWDPYMYSGHPFQADIQTAVLYPIAFANELIGRAGFSFQALEWEAIVHFGLTATFTFLLVRLLTGSTLAGLLGAITFTFSGFLTSYPSQQLPVLESTTWLPLELYGLERAARSAVLGRAKMPRLGASPWLALAGVSAGLAVLAGHPQTVLYLAYISAAYFLFRMPWRQWWRAVWVVLPALGLAAAQLLPSLQLFAVNHRGALAYAFAAGGLQLGDLRALLLDQPSGGRILYVGIIPLLLAVFAIVAVRNRQTVFWGVAAAVALLLSLGTHGPLFRVFFDYVPGWNLFRDQERSVVIVALAASILAGYGVVQLRASVAARLHQPKAAARVGMALGGVLVAVSAGNLWLANGSNNLSTEPPPSAGVLAGLLKPVAADKDIFRVRISQASLGHDDGNLLGLQFVSGDSPFELESFKEWTEDQPDGPRVTEWQLLRLTNSHYVLSSKDECTGPCQQSDGLRLLASMSVPSQLGLLESPVAATLRLYQVLFPLPRAFFVTQAQAVASQRQAIDAINRPGFDGTQTILLQTDAVPHSTAPDPAAKLRTDVVGYAPGFVDVRTSSDRPAYLFLSEVAYPDWQATVDGRPASLLTADGLFNALDMPPGQHHVVLRYVPRLLYLGGAISALTVVALVVWAIAAMRRRNGGVS